MKFSFISLLIVCVALCLFYLVRMEARAYVLLAVSFFYVLYLDRQAFVWLIAVTLFTYLAGLLMQQLLKKGRKKASRLVMAAAVAADAGLLLLMKYCPLLSKMQTGQEDILRLFILPLGFSYYIFQAVSYLADLQSGKLKAQKNLFEFALYMCFFPKFISGPIERAGDFEKQIRGLSGVCLLDKGRIGEAACYLLCGAFMKAVVADRIGYYTPSLMENPAAHGSAWLLMGVLLYTMQIYCDFAGYSMMAVGLAKLFGIELTLNFNAPYLSKSPSEFWRRWHISLSKWLRDYIYIPLGGNRKGRLRQMFNTIVVFVLCGMWHGSGLKFVLWGLLHGVFSALFLLTGIEKKEGGLFKSWLSRIITFLVVSFGWILFAVPDMGTAVFYLKRIFIAGAAAGSFAEEMALMGMSPTELTVLLAGIIIVIIFDVYSYRKGKTLPELIMGWKYGWRYLFCYVVIVLLFIFTKSFSDLNAGSFLYMDY